LFGRINHLSRNGSTNIPKLVSIDNGVHNEYGFYVDINVSISIVGESREKCIVMGGLKINGNERDDVYVSNLTIRGSKRDGVNHRHSASVHLDNVSVEKSRWRGIFVNGNRDTMKNCNVSHSKGSGLFVGGGGLMTIDGNGTTIHHNCTSGNGYGLYADPSSSIHLVPPLTLELVSKNNGRGRNSGGRGTIKIIAKEAAPDSDDDSKKTYRLEANTIRLRF